MCRRDTNDMLVRNFLDHYKVNLLSMPGRRVVCGSVYVKQGKQVTAPGLLSEIVKPELILRRPFKEPKLADLSGVWSGSVSLDVGIALLHNFLAALGAAGLIDKLRASIEHTDVHSVRFRFREVSRESISPMALGNALAGHQLNWDNGWVKDGNQYFAVASVLRSASISIQGRDQRDAAVGLGEGRAGERERGDLQRNRPARRRGRALRAALG
jgi:hypothetical protein